MASKLFNYSSCRSESDVSKASSIEYFWGPPPIERFSSFEAPPPNNLESSVTTVEIFKLTFSSTSCDVFGPKSEINKTTSISVSFIKLIATVLNSLGLSIVYLYMF